MSTKTTNDQKRTAVRPRYWPLGIDGQGKTHYYDRDRDRVHICLDGKRVQVVGFAGYEGQSRGKWLEAIANSRGWQVRWDYDGADDTNWFADTVEVHDE